MSYNYNIIIIKLFPKTFCPLRQRLTTGVILSGQTQFRTALEIIPWRFVSIPVILWVCVRGTMTCVRICFTWGRCCFCVIPTVLDIAVVWRWCTSGRAVCRDLSHMHRLCFLLYDRINSWVCWLLVPWQWLRFRITFCLQEVLLHIWLFSNRPTTSFRWLFFDIVVSLYRSSNSADPCYVPWHPDQPHTGRHTEWDFITTFILRVYWYLYWGRTIRLL